MEEEITEEAKCFIDIASDSQVIEDISKAGYLHYLIDIFSTCKTKEVSFIKHCFSVGMGESLFLMIADRLATAKFISDKLGFNSS